MSGLLLSYPMFPLLSSSMTVRTYDVYFQTKYNAVKKWEVYAKNAYSARCSVEEMNPGSRITRVLLSDNSDW